MLVLFSDFGPAGPYVGQMKAVLQRLAPAVPVVDLFADAPARDPRAAAYLLAAYAAWFPAESVFLAVVDPGVGGARAALIVEADGRRYVGPDNGLFELVRRRARTTKVAEITWRPPALSASFHGRDLFAPVAGKLARGLTPAQAGLVAAPPVRRLDWPDDLAAIVYIDRYGNAMTGMRAASLGPTARLAVGGKSYARARTFGDAPEGGALWYENANGLAELAVNRGRADALPGVAIGAAVALAGL